MRAMPRLPLPAPESMKLVTLAEIARGGMGSVELARAEGGRLHGQLLAIKRLHASVAQDPQFVGMFLDEAWMTAALDSPNVVHVAAWGNDARGMYLAVEFVRGVSLSRLMKEAATNHEPFAERTVAYVASQLCAGLSAAHSLVDDEGQPLGLVHRDLTPGNVLLSFEGAVKIVDFGIAKAEERITHTRTGTLKGKPAYMAPEQARGGKIDGRADIFSLGVVMFEMLTGRRPWTAKSPFDVMMEVASNPPPELVSLRPNVSPEFIAIVKTCLEKKPEDRFSSAKEIQDRLDAWRRSKSFDAEDASSLAGFVTRNSAPQIRWYEEALRGEMMRDKKLSYKELEERIDAEREGHPGGRRPSGLRPAAGRPVSDAAAALQGLSAPAPSPMRSTVNGEPPGRLITSEPQEMPTIVNPGARSTSQPSMAAVGMPVTHSSPTADPPMVSLQGTHFMPVSPLRQSNRPPAAQTPQPPLGLPPARGNTSVMPDRPLPAPPAPGGAMPPQNPTPARSALGSLESTEHMRPGIPQARPQSSNAPKGPNAVPNALEATVFDPSLSVPQAKATPAPPKKSSAAPLAIVFLLVLCAAAVAGYFALRGRAAGAAPASTEARP
jgi:serine/threonine protein kinase